MFVLAYRSIQQFQAWDSEAGKVANPLDETYSC